MSAPTPAIDAAAPVREGEALDLAALRRWLDVACPELVGDVALTQFPAGHSNLTYLLTIGDREVVLRRPPFGARIASAHDMGREYRLLSALHPVWPRVPRPLACCDDAGVLGAPFYLMERLRGVIVRKRLPAGVDASPEGVDRLCGALADTLVEVHGVDWRAAGLGPLYKGDGYVARQMSN